MDLVLLPSSNYHNQIFGNFSIPVCNNLSPIQTNTSIIGPINSQCAHLAHFSHHPPRIPHFSNPTSTTTITTPTTTTTATTKFQQQPTTITLPSSLKSPSKFNPTPNLKTLKKKKKKMAQPSSSSAPPPSEPEQNHPQKDEIEKNPSSQEPSKPCSSSISPPTKKIQPLPWTHLETVNLIEVYQNKWYSLKRGQLKASQWEEVAISVAARCGFDEPSKTATQCRHKMEKLRKRYRSEKQRSTISTWTYFDLMDQMERGPFPISVRPVASIDPSRRVSVASVDPNHRVSESTDDDSDDDVDDNVPDAFNKSRSINHILRKPPIVSRFVDKSPRPQWNGIGSSAPREAVNLDSRVVRNPMNPVYQKKRKTIEIEEEEDDEVEEEEEEEEERGGGGGELLMELASVIRKFGEGFVKIENMKMEMMKETERYRMEMESKRTEMILNSQNRIVDTIAKAFSSRKKLKESQEI